MNNVHRQSSLFETPQPDLFDGVATAAPLDEEQMRRIVRGKIASLVAEARAAERMPWTPQVAHVNATIVHNMANWLPENERDSMRRAFTEELDRLKAA